MIKNTSYCKFTVNVRKIQTESGSVASMQWSKYNAYFAAINVPEANVRKSKHTISELTVSKWIFRLVAQVVRALPNETEQKWVHVARCFSTTLADNTAHATETVVSGLCEEFLLEEDCTGGELTVY